MKRILIVVDMQTDFVDGTLGSPAAQAILPAVAGKIQRFRAAGDAVLFTLDTHPETYLETFEGKHLPVAHCIAGTPGHALHPALLPLAEGCALIEKPTFGCVELPALLAPMLEADTVLELCGLCTDICVVSNALLLRAHFPQAEICVDPACCAGVSAETHAAALSVMRCCQITIL